MNPAIDGSSPCGWTAALIMTTGTSAVLGVRAQLPVGLAPIDARHHHVHQHQIGTLVSP